MESFRHQRSPGSERFLGLFTASPPSLSNGAASAVDELDEDDIFSAGSDPCPSPTPDPIRHLHNRLASAKPSQQLPSMASTDLSPSPSTAVASATGLRRNFPPDCGFGILAVLPEEDKKRNQPFIHRKATVAAASSSASTSPCSSLTSSGRMIPVLPKPKPDFVLSIPAGKIYQQSAPVNVPVVPPKVRKGWGELDGDGGDDDQDDEEMLPPHEIVARASGNGSPMTTFSVLEGAGRTLKGSDLRRVRNAVWRKTGFLD